MAHITADRVRDTTTTTGTGALTVSGTAPTGYRTFSAVCSTSDTLWYAIQHQTAAEWEVGLGTYSSANTITRTTVLSSSNAGSAVSFSAGTKDIFITFPAAMFSGAVIGAAYGGTGASNLNGFVLAGTTNTVTVGYTVTPASISTGSFTITPANGNYQYVTNNGAYTITAPASDCAVDILITNGASAGATTFSGFTVGSSTGSALTTTNGNKFLLSVRRINAVSTYSIYALQ